MKKFLFGALALIVAAASFTGCKGKNNGGNNSGTQTITLTPVTMMLTPGEQKRITTKTEGFGENVTLSWTSSNESVATVSKNGTVTGINNGKATITCASGNVKATCEVSVVSLVETFTSFPTASRRLLEIEDKTLYDLAYADDTLDNGEIKTDTIRGYIAKIAINLWSEGTVYANGTGSLTGTATMAMIYLPAYAYYIDHTSCPKYFKDGEFWYYGLVANMFNSNDKKADHSIDITTIDKDAYWTHMNAGVEAWNNGDAKTFYQECAYASAEGFKGAALTIYEYDDEDGYVPVSWMPDAIVEKARIGLIPNDVYDFMYFVTGAVQVRPVLGMYGMGINILEDEFGGITVTSEDIEFGESYVITLSAPQTSAPARVSEALDMRNIKKNEKLMPADVQLRMHKLMR